MSNPAVFATSNPGEGVPVAIMWCGRVKGYYQLLFYRDGQWHDLIRTLAGI